MEVIFAVIVLLSLIGLIMGIPVYFLWNWVVPDIFGLPEIGFWQAVGLSLLCTFLFKSPGASSK